MCVWEGDCNGGPTFFHSATVKARKSCRCVECHSEIPVGSRYRMDRGKWDGKFDTVRMCLACDELGGVFICNGSWMYGEMLDNIHEGIQEMGDVNLGCIDGLSAEARERLFEIMDDIQDEEDE